MAEDLILMVLPVQRFFDTLGEPLAGGKLYSFVTGTSTPKALYADLAGTTPLTNPVILDATGSLLAYLLPGDAYRLDLFDANNVHQPGWPVDGVTGLGSSGSTFVPVLRGSTTPGVGVYNSQQGIYQRVGTVVWFFIFLGVLSHTGTGAIRVHGLPVETGIASLVNVQFYGSDFVLPGPVVPGYLREAPAMEIELYTQTLATPGLTAIPFSLVSASPLYNVVVSGVYTVL